MADQPQNQAQKPSGSRWEHDDDNGPESPDLPADRVPAAPREDAAAEERRAQLRGRAILAGAATALTLGGGLTGFVIGHATAEEGGGFRPANFSRQGPGDGGLPGNGRQVPPGFDQDGDGAGPADGAGPENPGDPT